jgi:hypothetical protein
MTVGATGAMSFAGTATFSAGSAATSIPMKVDTGTASGVTAAGQMYFESDTEIMTIGDGATAINLDFAPDTTITFPTSSKTLAANDQTFYIGTTSVAINRTSAALTLAGITLTTPDIGAATGTSLALGADPADAGAVRLSNNTNIAWEIAATGTDATLGVNASDDMVAALVAATDIFHITTGNFKIGATAQTQTFDGADAFISGFLEVDGVVHADGGFISGGQNKLYSANADPTATAGYILHDSTVTNHANGAVRWHDGTNIRQVVDMVAATIEACTDTQVVAYNASTDLFYCKADANDGGATALNAIGDAAADGTIAAGGYETTITSTLDEANHSVLTIYNNDADRAADTFLLKDDDAADANAFFLNMVADADGTPATILSISSATALSGALAWDLGGATSFELPNGANPTVDATGEIAVDTDGANEAGDLTIRVFDGTNTVAIARKLECIDVTVVKPQDMADAVRDLFPVWSNNTGMTFTITEIKAWSSTDDTTLNVEVVTDTNFGSPALVDAIEIATNGTSVFTDVETTISDATIAHDEMITLDFDDTDDPAYVKLSICGWLNGAVD